jgi:hypothetical protein
MNQKTGAAAIVAILAAIGSYIATCTGHGFWGLMLSIVGVIAGVIGLLMAASPKVSGGILSIVAIAMSLVGVVLGFLVGVLGVVF